MYLNVHIHLYCCYMFFVGYNVSGHCYTCAECVSANTHVSHLGRFPSGFGFYLTLLSVCLPKNMTCQRFGELSTQMAQNVYSIWSTIEGQSDRYIIFLTGFFGAKQNQNNLSEAEILFSHVLSQQC